MRIGLLHTTSKNRSLQNTELTGESRSAPNLNLLQFTPSSLGSFLSIKTLRQHRFLLCSIALLSYSCNVHSSQLARISSSIKLNSVSRDRCCFTVEEYCDLSQQFYNKNKRELDALASVNPSISFDPSAMRNSYIASMFLLSRIGQKLGFREDGNGVMHVDISWPSIKSYAECFLPLTEEIAAVAVEDTSQPLNFENLRYLLRRYGGHAFKKDRRVSDLTGTEIEELINICVAHNTNRLFNLEYLSHEEEVKFKEMLREVLGSSTGFQRVMTLLTLNIINNDDFQAFCCGTTSITILSIADKNNRALQNRNKHYINLHFPTLVSSTVLHESTHCFHWMLFGYANNPAFYGNFHNYSIMNATKSDFIKVYYPLLSNTENEIQKIICNKLNELKRVPNFIPNILKACAYLIKNGFGSVVFEVYARNERMRTSSTLSITDLLEDDGGIARIISTYIIALLERNGEKATHWTDACEMLTIIGQVPVQINGNTFAITDRHSELIYAMRSSGNSWTDVFKSGKHFQDYFFRQHTWFPGEDTGSKWEKHLNFNLNELFGLSKDTHIIHVDSGFFRKKTFNKPSDLLYAIESEGQGIVNCFYPNQDILDNILPCQAYQEWKYLDPTKDDDNNNSSLNKTDDIRRVFTALGKGDLINFQCIIYDIFNDTNRSQDFIQYCSLQSFIEIGRYGWKYARELIKRNIPYPIKVNLISQSLCHTPEVASDVLQFDNSFLLPNKVALSGVFLGVILTAASTFLKRNRDIEKILDCVRTSNVSWRIKALTLEPFKPSDLSIYNFVKALIQTISSSGTYTDQEITSILTKLFALFPFPYSVHEERYRNLCQKAIKQFSMFDYLSPDVRTTYESIMSEWCNVDPKNKVDILKLPDPVGADGPLFVGDTLLHYAASLENPPDFLEKLADKIGSSLPEDQLLNLLCKRNSIQTDTAWSPFDTAFDVAIKFDRDKSLAFLCKILNGIFTRSTNDDIKHRCLFFRAAILNRSVEDKFHRIICENTPDMNRS
ncbi:MAG: hypothetical protein LBJ89_02775 [Holosporales bacterium]|jgi:hypothetical protein|nr:hypothetical protein [Holosporales bacterium]